MKKIIASLVLAAGLAASAHAQTINGGSGSATYQVGIMEATTGPVAGIYTYSYTATLNSTSPNIDVNTFNIDNIAGFTGVSGVSSQSSGLDFVASGNSANSASFQSLTGTAGLKKIGDNATFFVDSTLPPVATVSVVANASNGDPNAGNLGGTTGSKGPTGPGNPAVPESNAFSLLGLGLLPLGMIARRRLANDKK